MSNQKIKYKKIVFAKNDNVFQSSIYKFLQTQKDKMSAIEFLILNFIKKHGTVDVMKLITSGEVVPYLLMHDISKDENKLKTKINVDLEYERPIHINFEFDGDGDKKDLIHTWFDNQYNYKQSIDYLIFFIAYTYGMTDIMNILSDLVDLNYSDDVKSYLEKRS